MSSPAIRPQSFQNHRAIPAASYLLAGLVLAADAGHRAWLAFGAPGLWSICSALAGMALVIVWYASRRRAQIVQDRVIRLEMQLRLERLLGPARRAEIEHLELPQRIALRFAGDEELPALFERVRKGEFAKPDDIKRSVKNWQADWLRV